MGYLSVSGDEESAEAPVEMSSLKKGRDVYDPEDNTSSSSGSSYGTATGMNLPKVKNWRIPSWMKDMSNTIKITLAVTVGVIILVMIICFKWSSPVDSFGLIPQDEANAPPPGTPPVYYQDPRFSTEQMHQLMSAYWQAYNNGNCDEMAQHLGATALVSRSFTNGHYVGKKEFVRICGIDVKPLKDGELHLQSSIVDFKHMGDSVSFDLENIVSSDSRSDTCKDYKYSETCIDTVVEEEGTLKISTDQCVTSTVTLNELLKNCY